MVVYGSPGRDALEGRRLCKELGIAFESAAASRVPPSLISNSSLPQIHFPNVTFTAIMSLTYGSYCRKYLKSRSFLFMRRIHAIAAFVLAIC